MKKSWIVIGLLAGIMMTMGTSCADKPKSLNPNGDSELALLMRAMHEEGMVTKQQLLKESNLNSRLIITNYSRLNLQNRPR